MSPSCSAAICRITAARFVRRISGSVNRGRDCEVILGVQTDAHAGRDATRAARPLRGRGLRDRLDGQPLHLRPAAVARDPCGAGVDDVADPWHGQRRLGDVGGEHDASAGVRLRKPSAARPLAAGRTAAALRCACDALRSASAVSRISRSPERNTSTSPGGSFSSSAMASTIASVWSRISVRTISWSGSSGSSSSSSAATATSSGR